MGLQSQVFDKPHDKGRGFGPGGVAAGQQPSLIIALDPGGHDIVVIVCLRIVLRSGDPIHLQIICDIFIRIVVDAIELFEGISVFLKALRVKEFCCDIIEYLLDLTKNNFKTRIQKDRPLVNKKELLLHKQQFYGAGERIRTSMKLLSHGPEPCASANSATPARLLFYNTTDLVFVKDFFEKV